jgi:hypothetical protein
MVAKNIGCMYAPRKAPCKSWRMMELSGILLLKKQYSITTKVLGLILQWKRTPSSSISAPNVAYRSNSRPTRNQQFISVLQDLEVRKKNLAHDNISEWFPKCWPHAGTFKKPNLVPMDKWRTGNAHRVLGYGTVPVG